MRLCYHRLVLGIFLCASSPALLADAATVAVATNFGEVLQILEEAFERSSGHELTIVTGSTGKLYAQVVHGAPYDVFLAADEDRPRLLVTKRMAEPETLFTYAVGRLSLWSAEKSSIADNGIDTLRQGNFRHLAIANPALAPYGAAAREVLEALDLYKKYGDRIVVGENIGQTWAMVATGNAELGLVALSSVLSPRNRLQGSSWEVPDNLYTPIRQDAVLLRRGMDNVAARAFMHWLRGEAAISIIRKYGYYPE